MQLPDIPDTDAMLPILVIVHVSSLLRKNTDELTLTLRCNVCMGSVRGVISLYESVL